MAKARKLLEKVVKMDEQVLEAYFLTGKQKANVRFAREGIAKARRSYECACKVAVKMDQEMVSEGEAEESDWES